MGEQNSPNFAKLSYPIYHFEPPLVKPNVEFSQHLWVKNGAKTRHGESLSGYYGNNDPINDEKSHLIEKNEAISQL